MVIARLTIRSLVDGDAAASYWRYRTGMIRPNPDRLLALSYADARVRPSLEALFALDDTLAAILRTTREPLVGQMRLTWWYEALGQLDAMPAPAEPVLDALQHSVLPHGVSGAMLAALTDGWDVLLEPTLDATTIERFAKNRGRALFDLAAALSGASDARIGIAGEGWALADLSQRLRDPAERAAAREMANARLDQALRGRWPKPARMLGALALSARFDLADTPSSQGSPGRVARLALHRLTGY